MKINLNDNLWELYNEYSIKGVMIISKFDFKWEIERIGEQTRYKALTTKNPDGLVMSNEKINELEFLDQYFPKEDKRRGEALVCVIEAFLLGKELNDDKCTNSEVLE